MDSITASVLIASIAAVTGITNTIVGYFQAKRTAEIKTKTENIVETTNTIHSLTNSSLSEMTHRLEIALEKVNSLEKLVMSMSLLTVPIKVMPAKEEDVQS